MTRFLIVGFFSLFFTFSSNPIFGNPAIDTASSDTIGTWSSTGTYQLNISQGALSNWVKGGENLFTFASNINQQFIYKRNALLWTNTGKWQYSTLKVGDVSHFKKTDDLIELNSKLGYKAFRKWYYSAVADFKTQFFKGYNYPNDSIVVSDWMSPAYWIITMGIDYRPNKDFSLYLSPLTSKTTIVSKTAIIDETNYGLEEGERIRAERGSYLKIVSHHKFNDKTVNNTTLSLFSNYMNHPENIDIDLETNTIFKFNKFLSVSLLLHFIYDDDIKIPVYQTVNGKKIKIGDTRRLQFKELMGFGITYQY